MLCSSPGTPQSVLMDCLHELLAPPEPTILAGDFNIDIKSSFSIYITKQLFKNHRVVLATYPSETTTNANMAINAIFASFH
jgi:hypothetical protein